MTISRYSRLIAKHSNNPFLKDNFIEKYIPKSIQKYFIPERPLPLGRWTIPKTDNDKYNYDKIHNHANLANYDHCDPCGREFTPNNFEKK
tara:strand:- start:121 stop:390 length:270 start_codon:yes stop_codon:yes gene_type:complete